MIRDDCSINRDHLQFAIIAMDISLSLIQAHPTVLLQLPFCIMLQRQNSSYHFQVTENITIHYIYLDIDG